MFALVLALFPGLIVILASLETGLYTQMMAIHEVSLPVILLAVGVVTFLWLKLLSRYGAVRLIFPLPLVSIDIIWGARALILASALMIAFVLAVAEDGKMPTPTQQQSEGESRPSAYG